MMLLNQNSQPLNAHTKKVMLAFADAIKEKMPQIDVYVDHEWQSGAWIFFAKDLFKAVPVCFLDSTWFNESNMANKYHATLEYNDGNPKINKTLSLSNKAEFDIAVKTILGKIKNL
jgi:hypothetical protein